MTPAPIERCCPSHASWSVLCSHLVAAFPTVEPREVVDHVVRARAAVERFTIPAAESIDTAELIARYQLLQLAGDVPTVARLDPERRIRRMDREPALPA